MKVFISWSGKASGILGKALVDFIPVVLQGTIPFFSPEMKKGIDWFQKIAEELRTSDFSILCLTRSNVEEPWMLFEAGAMAVRFEKGRVAPLAIDFEPTDLAPPLGQLNAAVATKDEILEIIKTINSYRDVPVLDDILITVFNSCWSEKMEKQVAKAIKEAEKAPDAKKAPAVSQHDKINEILTSVRSIKNQMHIASAIPVVQFPAGATAEQMFASVIPSPPVPPPVAPPPAMVRTFWPTVDNDTAWAQDKAMVHNLAISGSNKKQIAEALPHLNPFQFDLLIQQMTAESPELKTPED